MQFLVSYRDKPADGVTTRRETLVEADNLKEAINSFINTNPFSLIYFIQETNSNASV